MNDDSAREDREELAADRTDFAEDRTLLANERTFAGWLRTGLATVGIGIGFHALFTALEPPWVPKGIATAILLIGIFIFIAADRRACAVNKRLHAHAVSTFEPINIRIITVVLVLATLALTAGIWMLT